MRAYFQWLGEAGDPELRAYVESRAGTVSTPLGAPGSLFSKLGAVSPRKIYNKLFYLYLHLVSHAFHSVAVRQAHTSSIPNFNDDLLDVEADGRPYKCTSLYLEAIKPLESEGVVS